jgi:hypothetical protein
MEKNKNSSNLNIEYNCNTIRPTRSGSFDKDFVTFTPYQSRSSSKDRNNDPKTKILPTLSRKMSFSRRHSTLSFSGEHSVLPTSLTCSIKNTESSDDDVVNQLFDEPNQNITSELQIKLLQDYIDRCYIMTIMCDQSSNYYTRMKYLFQVPIIISSSTMTIVNSNTSINDNNIVNIFNIAINVLITVLIALQSTFMITEKSYQFKLNAAKFSKLEHFIENKMINSTPTTEFIENITLQYNSHIDDIDYVIPEYIKKDMRMKFEGKRRLPFMINLNEHYESNEPNCNYFINADLVGINNSTNEKNNKK